MSASAGSLIRTALPYDILLTVLTLGRERKFRERLLAPARLSPGESVLDIGCGTGSLAIAAAARVGARGSVTGVDPSPAMIERARHKSRRITPTIRYEVAYAQSMPFPDEHFDVVLSTLMLHHMRRATREEAVRETRRVLKPGGRLLAVDFGVNPGDKRGMIGHLHRNSGLNAQYLSDLASSAGFAVAESGRLGLWDLQYVLAHR